MLAVAVNLSRILRRCPPRSTLMRFYRIPRAGPAIACRDDAGGHSVGTTQRMRTRRSRVRHRREADSWGRRERRELQLHYTVLKCKSRPRLCTESTRSREGASTQKHRGRGGVTHMLRNSIREHPDCVFNLIVEIPHDRALSFLAVPTSKPGTLPQIPTARACSSRRATNPRWRRCSATSTRWMPRTRCFIMLPPDVDDTMRLLKMNAKVNAVDARGITPLHVAACQNHPRIVRMLCAADALTPGIIQERNASLTDRHLGAKAHCILPQSAVTWR